MECIFKQTCLFLLNPCISIPLAIVLVVYNYYRHWNRIRTLTKDIPGPPEFPIFGNLNFFGDMTDFWEIHNTIYRGFDKYGPIFKLWMAHELWICVCDANIIEPLNEYWKTYTALPSYNLFGFFKDKGFNYRTFYGKRKHLDLKLTPEIDSQTANNSIKQLVSSLKSSAEKGALSPEVIRSSIKESLKLFEKETNWQIRLSQNYLNKIYNPIQDKWDIFLWRVSVVVQQTVAQLVSKYVDSPRLDDVQMNTLVIDDSLPKGGEFDASCLSTQEISMRYTSHIFQELSKEAFDLARFQISESVEKTTVFMMNLLHEVAANPNVLEKIRSEVKRFHLSHDGRDPTLEDERKLRYTEAVLKEGLRLYAPPVVFKRAGMDFTTGTQTIPEHSLVYICTYHLHMDHEHYERPTKFYPEHFVFEVERDRIPTAYFPLVLEPGLCTDSRYILRFLKVMLVELVNNFSFETSTDPNKIKHDHFQMKKNLETIDLRFKPL